MNAPSPHRLEYLAPAPPAPEGAIEIAPGVLWLRMPLPFALDHINLWALADEVDGTSGWTLVDTGLGNPPSRELWSAHFTGALGGRPVFRVVVTHCHPDHLGNAAWLAEHFDCPVFMTQGEYLSAHAISEEHSGYGTAHTARLYAAHGLPDEHLEALRARGNLYRKRVPTVPSRYRRIVAGDALAIGGETWEIIPGLGHSPEHAALFCQRLGVLISGDMLLPRISTNVSVWPVDAEGDPLRLFLQSLALFEALPPDTTVLPSHGLPFIGIAIRVEQLRAHHRARLDELFSAASAELTAWDAVPLLFRRELDAQQIFFAMGEAIAHLNHLWHAERLRRLRKAGGRFHFVQ